MSHDHMCYNLARWFLGDDKCGDEAHTVQLAEEIQSAVDSYMDVHSGLTHETNGGD